MPVAHACNLATREAEIRRILVQSQPEQIVRENLSRKIPNTKKDWWSGPEFKPQVEKKKKCRLGY
jgi:hypothetical protein